MNGHEIIIYLRYGRFTVDIDGEGVFSIYPPGFDGVMSTDDMLNLTGFRI